MTEDRLTRALACYTSVLHDVMRAMGLRNFTLPPTLRPLDPAGTLAGPACTIEGRIDDTADPHETLLAWTGLLSAAPAGHVWVCQPNNHAIALMGELSAETLQRKGVLGCVIDGGLRDTSFLLRLGFPSWGAFNTPCDIVGRWLPTATGQPVHIGGVVISPGDWLHGDRDGMVRIPAARLDEALDRATAAMTTESLVRKAILAGTDPREAYLAHGKF